MLAAKKNKSKTKLKKTKINITSWNTTDQQEIDRRKDRAANEKMKVEFNKKLDNYYATFSIQSNSNSKYEVEIRSLSTNINSCGCPDYQANGLGTCKHIEKVLLFLKKVHKKQFNIMNDTGSPFIEIYLASGFNGEIKIIWPNKISQVVKNVVAPFFSAQHNLLGDYVNAIPVLLNEIEKSSKTVRKKIRVSKLIKPFYENLIQRNQRLTAKAAFLSDVNAGKQSLDITKYPLYPYQQQGMLHLVFNERALLADEMGLGKTAGQSHQNSSYADNLL